MMSQRVIDKPLVELFFCHFGEYDKIAAKASGFLSEPSAEHPTMSTNTENLVFISYASPDREVVSGFFDLLKSDGFNVWMDSNCLVAGQNWDFEIKRALDKATFVLMFISENSFSRRGYVQREIKLALDKLEEKLVDDIFIIPVLLSANVQIPEQLKGIQYITADKPECYERIVKALNHQLTRLGQERLELQERKQIRWTSAFVREEWDGLPGYEIELQFLNFSSDEYPSISQISDFIRGQFIGELFRHRGLKLQQSPELFNYGQNKFYRTNTYDAHCDEPTIIGKVLSLKYSVSWYGAGAAHPNHHFVTYSFILEPIFLIENIQSIFGENEQAAFVIIQSKVREDLYAVGMNDDESESLDRGAIDAGTGEWSDFSYFVFSQSGIEFLFAPYDVAAYACGPQTAFVPYELILGYLSPEYLSALGLEYLRFSKVDSKTSVVD